MSYRLGGVLAILSVLSVMWLELAVVTHRIASHRIASHLNRASHCPLACMLLLKNTIFVPHSAARLLVLLSTQPATGLSAALHDSCVIVQSNIRWE